MSWQHPTTPERVRFSPKTIECWLYTTRDQQDPIKALERKVPKHAGTFPSINDVFAAEIRGLRRDHPRWTFQLVHDNLVAIADDRPTLGGLAWRRHLLLWFVAKRPDAASQPRTSAAAHAKDRVCTSC